VNRPCIVRIGIEIIHEKDTAMMQIHKEKFVIEKQTQSKIEQNKKE
jgi:hypothetical protein